ncbi:dephospho-CoA kinase [uncultured Gemmiger sp.]|uniref:dephospho-CoA kinase n=1 Tax=uncultured Gemmiger sp. TaxID=1623490 RepID=UPI0025DB1AD8|nr:dephospho-CoA kinase [uncultured Gemmiger sp.]
MVVGLTGRSGCGKSSVSAFLTGQGYPCIDADSISREILQPGSPCLPRLQKTFGSDIVDSNGVLNRRLLADRAFATAVGTRQLTAITHPEILTRIRARVARARATGAKLCFVDGAVIVGTPFEAECDRLVVVTAPYAQSVERICRRDGIRPEMARRRLDAQTPEQTLTEAADYIICNNGTLADLEQRCRALLDALRKEAHETDTVCLSGKAKETE